MTHVSKKSLSPKTEAKLFAQLADLFVSTDAGATTKLFSELFTPAEKIMFIKRVAIVLMLDQDQSTYRIAQLLRVSDATVRRIQLQYEEGNYDYIVSLVHRKSFNREEFWRTLEVLLRLGMPSYGKDRWKGFSFN